MPHENIIIVENIEIFLGRIAICYEFFKLLYKWRRRGKLVICTCSTKKRPHFGWIDKYLCAVPVKPLRITGCVIRRLDKTYDLQLSRKEFYALSRMACMLDVEETLHTRRNKMHILVAMKRKSDTFDMRLTKDNFNKIDSGKKTIELRLYDEKRQKMKVGDTIIFTNNDRKDTAIVARIVALHIFKDFSELYKRLPLEQCGYDKKIAKKADSSDMNKYYTAEEQLLYDVVGIEFEVRQRM